MYHAALSKEGLSNNVMNNHTDIILKCVGNWNLHFPNVDEERESAKSSGWEASEVKY